MILYFKQNLLYNYKKIGLRLNLDLFNKAKFLLENENCSLFYSNLKLLFFN